MKFRCMALALLLGTSLLAGCQRSQPQLATAEPTPAPALTAELVASTGEDLPENREEGSAGLTEKEWIAFSEQTARAAMDQGTEYRRKLAEDFGLELSALAGETTLEYSLLLVGKSDPSDMRLIDLYSVSVSVRGDRMSRESAARILVSVELPISRQDGVFLSGEPLTRPREMTLDRVVDHYTTTCVSRYQLFQRLTA